MQSYFGIPLLTTDSLSLFIVLFHPLYPEPQIMMNQRHIFHHLLKNIPSYFGISIITEVTQIIGVFPQTHIAVDQIGSGEVIMEHPTSQQTKIVDEEDATGVLAVHATLHL